MIATYHNHSTWSDGRAPLVRIISRARALGVDELGISDHFVLHPSGATPSWSMHPDRLGFYVEDVLGFRDSRAPTVLLGLEMDWFPGMASAISCALSPYPFDYLIGSVHEVDGFVVDARADLWDAMTADQQNQVYRRYWLEIRSMADSGLFDIVGHLDLTKKFGHRPTADLGEPIDAALDAVAAAGMTVELNTAGWTLPCKEAYPSDDLLMRCRQRNIPVTITTDAHHPDHLLRDVERAVDHVHRAGYEEQARYRGRKIWFENLAKG